MPDLNIAVIGCGYWGPNLVRNFAELSGVNLVAVSDLNTGILEDMKRRYPYIRTALDYRELIESEDIHAVVIATPVQTHYQIAKEALQAGKHVQIEKPMASSVSEAVELTELAKQKGLTILVDHTFVYSSPVQILKQHIADLGSLRYFDSVRVNLGLFQQDINVIWDLAPHDVSILLYLTDRDPASVMAVGAAHINPRVENTAYVVARYEDDFIAHFHFNWLSPVKIRKTLISGSNKMIVYNDLDPIETVKIYDCGVEKNHDKNRIMVDYRTGNVLSPEINKVEALRNVCSDFVSCIRTGNTPVSDGNFGVRVLSVLEAANQSLSQNSSFVSVETGIRAG